MKKVISIMAAVFTLAAAVSFTAAAEKTFSLGDVNMSGKVDAVDASAILGAYAVKATGGDLPFDDTCAILADTNKDGLVDSKDASLVLAYYAYSATGGIVSPEEYYVNPSQQPTQYVLEDIKTDPEAYRYFSKQLCKELYNGCWMMYSWGNSSGQEICDVILGLLNYNQGIKPSVLDEVLSDYTTEEITVYAQDMAFASTNYLCSGTPVDFNKYMFDKKFANEINTINEYYVEAIKGNPKQFVDAMYAYVPNSPTIDVVDNYPKKWFYYCSGDVAYDLLGTNTKCITELEEEMYKERVRDYCSTFKGYSHTK